VQLTLTVLLLARLQPLLLLLLLFATPPLVGTRWAWKRFGDAWKANADQMRRATHYADLARRADAAKEARLFGLQDVITERLGAARSELRGIVFRVELAGVLSQAAGFLLFGLGYVGALLIVVRGAVRGAHSTGDVVLAVSLAAQTNLLVFGVVSAMQRLQRASAAADRMRSMRKLLDELYPPRDAMPTPAPERIERGIRIEDLDFRYPATDSDVLADVDLELPAGSTVALVGENGAGKSTLVKLLCRFYDPVCGRIMVDDVELATIDPAAWRQRIAAGFQDFVRFELLAGESVAVGDLSEIEDAEHVERAVDRGAARDVIEDLSAGIETPVGGSHPEGGTELSGSQWQKLAARDDARAPAAPHPRRAHLGPRRARRARALRTLCRLRTSGCEGDRRYRDLRLAPLLDRAHGRQDRRDRRGPRSRAGNA
jgi:ATP-binding cassette subfamily B protein